MKKTKGEKWLLLSQRQRISPFPNYLSLEGMTEILKEHVGMNLADTMMIYKDRLGIYFHDAKSFEQIALHIVELLKTDPKLYARFVDLQNKNGTVLVDFCKRISSENLQGLSDAAINDAWLEYARMYKLVYTSYGSVWIMEDYLNAELYKIIEKRVGDKPSRISEMLTVLTQQPTAMVSTIHRRALLALAIEIKKNAEWKKSVLERDEAVIKKLTELYEKIQKHSEDYYWVTRDYEDPILDISAVIGLLAAELEENPERNHAALLQNLERARSLRTKYEDELKFNEQEAALFEAMRDAAHLKELRKRYVSESLFHFDPILKEIGKRTHLTLKQVRFLTADQVRRALLDREDLANEVNEQIHLSVWRLGDGVPLRVTTGEEAQAVYNEFCVADPNMTEFTGMPVSPGKATGPAKIVLNIEECDKVEKGDIIVSVQVVPSFSTAIIKSAGIVCDGGHGITSHPATLAREAGIPCVIQTRWAKDVLKDGDRVEVDGYKGVVRKL